MFYRHYIIKDIVFSYPFPAKNFLSQLFPLPDAKTSKNKNTKDSCCWQCNFTDIDAAQSDICIHGHICIHDVSCIHGDIWNHGGIIFRKPMYVYTIQFTHSTRKIDKGT